MQAKTRGPFAGGGAGGGGGDAFGPPPEKEKPLEPFKRIKGLSLEEMKPRKPIEFKEFAPTLQDHHDRLSAIEDHLGIGKGSSASYAGGEDQ